MICGQYVAMSADEGAATGCYPRVALAIERKCHALLGRKMDGHLTIDGREDAYNSRLGNVHRSHHRVSDIATRNLTGLCCRSDPDEPDDREKRHSQREPGTPLPKLWLW